MTVIEVAVVVGILLALMAVVSVGVMSTVATSQADTERLIQAQLAEQEQIDRIRREERPAGGVAGPRSSVSPVGPAEPVVEAVELELALDARPVADWPWVHNLVDVRFTGRYVVTNPDPERETVRLRFPLPPGAQGVRFLVGEPGAIAYEPDATYTAEAVEWIAPLPPGTSTAVTLVFRAAGADGFGWRLPGEGQQRTFDLRAEVKLPPGFASTVPADALQPTTRGGDVLRWELDDLVAPPPLRVELPPGATPLGRIAAVCWLAALGLLGFCGGFWYLAEGERPGHLDDFRLGGLLLLALNYASFYVIFAVLGVELGVAAAPIALLTSLPLLTLHVTRLTSAGFAIRRVMPLAAATIGAILGAVYLDGWRPLVVLGAGVLATAWVTVTWRSWSTGRRSWRAALEAQQARAERLAELDRVTGALRQAIDARVGQLTAARRTLQDLVTAGAERGEVSRVVERLERAISRGRPLLQPPEDGELLGDVAHREQCAARKAEAHRACTQIEGLGRTLAVATDALERAAARAVDDLSAGVGELERALDAASLVEVEARAVAARSPDHLTTDLHAALQELLGVRDAAGAVFARVARPGDDDLRTLAVTARQLARAAEALVERLRTGLVRLTEAVRLLDRGDDPAEGSPSRPAVHCPVCGGGHSPGSRFCSGCGAKRPIELACGACGRVTRLPRHLLRDGWDLHPLRCGHCGVGLGAVEELCAVE